MTTGTQKTIVAIIFAIIGLFTVSIVYLVNSINEAGGVKEIIIEAGKEVKDIAREIEKH